MRSYSWAFETLPECDERHISDGIVERFGFAPVAVAADELWPLAEYPDHGPDRDDPFIRVYQPLFERTLAAARADGIGPLLTGDKGDETVGDWVFDHVGMIASGRLRSAWHEIKAHARRNGRSARTIVRREVVGPLFRTLLTRTRKASGAEAGVVPEVPGFIEPAWAQRIVLAEHLVRRAGEPQSGGARAARYRRIFARGGMLDPVPFARDCQRFGLELRNPWSDRRLASFVLAVPQWVVQRPSEPKRIARRAMRTIMPDAVLARASKIEPIGLFERGFSERARTTALDLLMNGQLAARGFVDESALVKNYAAVHHGDGNGHDPWWALTMEMWLRRYWA